MAYEYLNAVETEITVDGKPCDFIYLHLDQYMTSHHVFELAVSYRHEKQSVWAVTVDEIFRETLNKPVNIKMTHKESGDVNEFDGVVTDIEIVGIDGDKGTVVLKGGSPTILLDRDPSMGAFTDYTLHNIVAETIENTGVQVEVDNKPSLSQQIPYAGRHQESSYAFLSRLLYSFGEWFYYDGKKLIVGNPFNEESKEVSYDVELKEVSIKSCVKNLNVKLYDYDPTENNYFEESSTTISNANLSMKAAKQASDPLYPNPSKLPAKHAVLGENDMSKTARTHHSRDYTQMSVFTAKCKTCGVKIGEVATIFIPDSFKDVTFKDLGNFRILEVHHRVNKEGDYENEFTGITAFSETLPDNNIVFPVALQEPAIVVDNEDPRNQGRVKVRFLWQDESESTNWVRVQTPDAGRSNDVQANRGFVFIPEVGDQVMIGFRQGDPNRPYVMGSLFHRDNSKGTSENNNLKTISTKSGHIIEFNDNEQEGWGISITDRNGNTIHMDTAGKNIEVTAPENMILNAKNIEIRATENMFMNSGKNTIQNVGGDYRQEISGKDETSVGKTLDMSVGGITTITMDDNLTHKVAGKVVQDTEAISISAGNGAAKIIAKDALTLKSSTDVIIAQ